MHQLILGMTESGKTCLARAMCKRLKELGMKTAVLDPIGDDYDCDFHTSDPEEFLEYCKNNNSLHLFVDESSTMIGKYDLQMEWLATQSRHLGHSGNFITQRCTQISTTLRDQCSRMFVFATGPKGAEVLAEEWAEPALKKLPKVSRGEFIIVDRFNKARFGSIDFPTLQVDKVDKLATIE